VPVTASLPRRTLCGMAKEKPASRDENPTAGAAQHGSYPWKKGFAVTTERSLGTLDPLQADNGHSAEHGFLVIPAKDRRFI